MTISSVAPAVVPGSAPPGSTAPGSTGPGSTGLGSTGLGSAGSTGREGGVFADLLGSGAAADLLGLGPAADLLGSGAAADPGRVDASFPTLPAGAPVDPAAGGTPGVPELLSAAQIMAAAQVVPVTPVLTAALALQSAPVGTPTAGAPTAPAALAAPAAIEAAAPPAAVSAGVLPEAPSAAAAPAASAGWTAVPAGDQAPTVTPPGVPDTAQPSTAAETSAIGTNAAAPGEHRPHDGDARQQRPGAKPVNATPAAQPGAPLSGAPAPPQPASPAQVNGQVFPEVARLVTRGDGTRRITITLSPEALGDVRVVLTVKDGDVHVRMTGSEQAQQALRAGAPELHRLLDLAGASSSQVVVGDQGSSLDSGLRDGASARNTGQNPEDHRPAGTRDGDTSARDGSPGGPQPRPSSDPTATRGGLTRTLAGVDVTM